MNTRVRGLAVTLFGILGMLPGATAITVHAFGAWTYILITASTDAAVRAISHDLGLGAPQIRRSRMNQIIWWHRAITVWAPGHGEIRIEVAGPHHQGSPPAE
ncbi:MAG TPA: hypothetical protein VNO30_38015 [Kofleriaceae bacterium]|nr:hypothetical protein [Kofleriaceae bacterium]